MSNEEELGLPLGTGSLVLGYSTVSPRSHPPASLSSIIHGQSIDYLLSSCSDCMYQANKTLHCTVFLFSTSFSILV